MCKYINEKFLVMYRYYVFKGWGFSLSWNNYKNNLSYNVWVGCLLQMQYTFQQVFDEYTSQKSMFDAVAMSLVEDVLHGKNGSLICLFHLF